MQEHLAAVAHAHTFHTESASSKMSDRFRRNSVCQPHSTTWKMSAMFAVCSRYALTEAACFLPREAERPHRPPLTTLHVQGKYS